MPGESCGHELDGADTGGDAAALATDAEPGLRAPWAPGAVAARLVARVTARRTRAGALVVLDLEPLPVRSSGVML